MRNIVAFPILALAVILQSAVISRTTLLSGFADLPLVIVIAWALQDGVTTGWHWAILAGLLTGFVSSMPWAVPVVGFALAVLMTQLIQKRIWQAPLLAMLGVTFIATLTMHLLSYVVLSVFRAPLPFADTFSLITLPSVLLNMLLAIPVFWLTRDLARWVYPVEEEE
jgi:rod shape-determining protein MreD